ncbi:hypothetical protein HMPREF0185_00502 [Brevundimonas diminuta 470-4]|nr:hypothetical protein HMPREF0185_00502 [Brevundimonas diminuta 470-4]
MIFEIWQPGECFARRPGRRAWTGSGVPAGGYSFIDERSLHDAALQHKFGVALPGAFSSL